MTLSHVIFLIVALAGLVAACALYATLIADEPPATAATIMADTRRELTARGIADADALLAVLPAIVAAISEQREQLAAGTLDYVPLTIVAFKLRDLRRQVEALGVGL